MPELSGSSLPNVLAESEHLQLSCLLSARKCKHVGSHLQFYSAELEAQSEICNTLVGRGGVEE